MRTDSDLSAVRWHAGALNNGLIFGATYYLVTRLPRAVQLRDRSRRRRGSRIGSCATGTRAIVDNLRVVRPDATERELKRLALLTYRSYARDTIDFIRSLVMNRERTRADDGRVRQRPPRRSAGTSGAAS